MPYGTANVDTIQSSTAGTPVQFNDGNGTQIGTLCRAWVNFNGTAGASPVVRASFNVSSVTRGGTGQYTINFTNAFADTNYGITSFARASASYYLFVSASGSSTKTTSALTVFSMRNDVGNFDDSPEVGISIFR